MLDISVVDAIAPSRLNQSSLGNPGTTATESEARTNEEYRELIDNGYIFKRWPWKYRVLWARAVIFFFRVSVNSAVVRTRSNELAAF